MAGFTGIVHQDKDDLFWFDDQAVRAPKDVPRRAAWSGTTWYTTSAVSMARLIALMGPDDEAFGPTPERPLGVHFRWNDGKRGYKVISSSLWGVRKRDPRDTEAELSYRMHACAQDGVMPRLSAAGTAIRRYMDVYDGRGGRPFTRQLPPRWRAMAHASFHGGPIVLTRGSARECVHIDMRAAYLDAMTRPLPVYGVLHDRKVGGWYTIEGASWGRIRNKIGFIEAEVHVDQALGEELGIPPLPVRLGFSTTFPTGTFSGCWPIQMVREAEDRGEVSIKRVHQWCFAPSSMPLFDEIAKDFGGCHQGKLLYTRFWGKWASKGGFLGKRSDDPPSGSIKSCGIWWGFDGVAPFSHQAPATYRPDLAALIAGYNHMQVMAAVRQLQPGSVVGLHVDAIWTTDIEGAEALINAEGSRWIEKQRGPARFYGPGVYHHNSRIAASGYDATALGPLTPETLALWSASPLNKDHRGTMQSRRWSAPPAMDAAATSRPVHLEAGQTTPPVQGPNVNDSCWTTTGWLKREIRDQLEAGGRGIPPDRRPWQAIAEQGVPDGAT